MPSPSPAPLVIACDGSRSGNAQGYAYYAGPDLYDFGDCPTGQNAELSAVTRALLAVPARTPVRLLSDSHEVHLRLEQGLPPRPGNAHAQQWADAATLVATRQVTFQSVHQDTQRVPLHSVAHYLAFLGRIGQRPTPGDPAPMAAEVLAAEDPDAFAHDLVVEHLFPVALRGHRAR